MDDNTLLTLEGVTKRFPGVLALDHVGFTLRPGTVHALMGENGAGKSTLMNCLLGSIHMDEGQVTLAGKELKIDSVRDANQSGIFMIHQEMSPVMKRSVMENMWLGREPIRLGMFVDHRKMYTDTKRLLADFGMSLDPRVLMETLGVAQIQMLEIIKEMSKEARVLIMDEPTSALTNKETEHLFGVIGKLKQKGIGIIFISHKMDEIFRIADEVTVMRDGRYISTYPIADVTMDSLIRDMVGRDLKDIYEKEGVKQMGETLLAVESLSSGTAFRNVSFTLRKGEIVGLAGMVGAGRTEIIEALYGLRNTQSGTVTIRGKAVRIKHPRSAIQNGIVMLAEDRKRDGIFPVLGVGENMVSACLKNYMNKVGLLAKKLMKKDVNSYVEKLRIKTPSIQTSIGNLSGGNQQKVLLARNLLCEPHILLLDEPTRGIDVGAKVEIYSLIYSLAMEGKAILMVSAEMTELLNICDRILVMHNGKLMGELSSAEASQEKIMALASGLEGESA